MPVMQQEITKPLVNGDHLTRDEFLRRWNNMPWLKKAELIEGRVYTSSFVTVPHGTADSDLNAWLNFYKTFTLGCALAMNATCFLGKDLPQPDSHLRVLKEYGGKSWVGKNIVCSNRPTMEYCVPKFFQGYGWKLRRCCPERCTASWRYWTRVSNRGSMPNLSRNWKRTESNNQWPCC